MKINVKKRLFIFLILAITTGCTVFKTVHYIKNEDVKTIHYQFNEKEIIFVPMIHFGQKKFYDGVRDSIIEWKKQGYIVYYEEMISDTTQMNVDSAQRVVLGMKTRRMMGMMPTREEYEKEFSKTFKTGVAQPDNFDLGIDSTDLNADISLKDLINEAERTHGEIILDSCDYATPLDTDYSCHKKWNKKDIASVLIDFRNEYVVKLIQKSKKKKFIVVYGASHMKGMMKLMDEIE